MFHRDILRALEKSVAAAKLERDDKYKRWTEIIQQAPSGIPFPDSIDRIRQAAADCKMAIRACNTAVDNLHNYLVNRTIPPDLDGTREN